MFPPHLAVGGKRADLDEIDRASADNRVGDLEAIACKGVTRFGHLNHAVIPA